MASALTRTESDDLSLEIYLKEIRRTDLLTPEQEVELAKRIKDGTLTPGTQTMGKLKGVLVTDREVILGKPLIFHSGNIIQIPEQPIREERSHGRHQFGDG